MAQRGRRRPGAQLTTPPSDGWVKSERQLDREAARRSAAMRAALVASVSTAVLFGVFVVAIVSSPGWPTVRDVFFNWGDARAAFPDVASGFWVNVKLFMIAEPLILVLALAVAVVRVGRSPLLFPLRLLATVYTDVFRGVPTLLVVYLTVFGIPALQLNGLPTDKIVFGGVGADPQLRAYVAEVLRAGIESVSPKPAVGRTVVGTVQRANAALRGDPASGTPGDAAAPQRLRLASKGHRVARQRGRRRVTARGGTDRAHQVRVYAIPRHSRLLPRADDSVGPVHGLAGTTNAPQADRGRYNVSEVRLDGVWKAYGDHVVLGGIDLTVDSHTVVTLIGSSDSGKSTMLRCMNLLDTVDDGVITLGGDDITDPRVDPDQVRQRIGMVFQQFNLFPHMTVLDNLTLAPRRVQKMTRAAATDKAMTLLNRVGLQDKAESYPDRLSGGQQQRAALARSLMTDPEVMLLDEVTSALDPELVGEVLDMIRGLKDGGMTLVMATHEMAFAREVSDQVCFLDKGVIVERGTPEQFFADPQTDRTRQFLRRVMTTG